MANISYSFGLGWTDSISHIVYIFLNMVFYISDILMFRGHSAESQKFIKLTIEIGTRHSEDGLVDETNYDKFAAKFERNIKLVQACQIIGTILICSLMFYFFTSALEDHGFLSRELTVKLAILSSIEVLFLLFVLMPMASMGFDAGICRCTRYLALAFEKWVSSKLQVRTHYPRIKMTTEHSELSSKYHLSIG